MTTITDLIDAHYEDVYDSLNIKYWGLAELTDYSGDRFPITVGERHKVCIDERYDACVWYREISGNQTDNEELSYGLEIKTQMNVTLRIIVAYKVELGEMFKYEFMNNFPKNIGLDDVSPSNYEYLEIGPGSIDLDHEKIAVQEEIHTQYNKHRVCWNIFTFDNEIQFIICE